YDYKKAGAALAVTVFSLPGGLDGRQLDEPLLARLAELAAPTELTGLARLAGRRLQLRRSGLRRAEPHGNHEAADLSLPVEQPAREQAHIAGRGALRQHGDLPSERNAVRRRRWGLSEQ